MTTVARLVGALLVALTTAGCWAQPATLAPPEAPDVVLFGDSLSAWSREATLPLYDAAGLDVSYNAVGGTQLDHWAAAMANVPAGAVVVVALGTNDITNNTHQVFGADMAAAAAELDDAVCQVWLTVNETGAALRDIPYSSRTAWFNDELARMTAEHPNMVLWDWNGASAGHPGYLVADHVHHTDAGNLAYAATLADAAGACGA